MPSAGTRTICCGPSGPSCWNSKRSTPARLIDQLQHQLQQVLRRLYGRSAEKLDPRQMQLFETLLNQLAPPTFVPPEPPPSPAARSTRGHGRRRLPTDLSRQRVIHDLPEEQKPCPCCGQPRHIIGQKVERILARHGIPIARSTLCDWMAQLRRVAAAAG